MNNSADAVWEFINDTINTAGVLVINGHQPKPRPSDLPYIAFYITELPQTGWDSFEFDEVAEIMSQEIVTEAMVDIRGVGDGAEELLFKIFAAAGWNETQLKLNDAGFVIYDRSRPEKKPYITEVDTLPGASMIIKIRGVETIEHQMKRIDKVETTGELVSDSGELITIENEINL